MDQKANKVIANYIDAVRTSYPKLTAAYLFGSYATDTHTADSDIDLALVFDALTSSDRFELQVELMVLASTIDSRIEPHPISIKDFSTNNPFVTEITQRNFKIY